MTTFIEVTNIDDASIKVTLNMFYILTATSTSGGFTSIKIFDNKEKSAKQITVAESYATISGALPSPRFIEVTNVDDNTIKLTVNTDYVQSVTPTSGSHTIIHLAEHASKPAREILADEDYTTVKGLLP
jgi:hypothetical protein